MNNFPFLLGCIAEAVGHYDCPTRHRTGILGFDFLCRVATYETSPRALNVELNCFHFRLAMNLTKAVRYFYGPMRLSSC
jgi:hypothetical protein